MTLPAYSVDRRASNPFHNMALLRNFKTVAIIARWRRLRERPARTSEIPNLIGIGVAGSDRGKGVLRMRRGQSLDRIKYTENSNGAVASSR
jgi:hypothetical protein